MDKYHFLKVAAAVPAVQVASPVFNAAQVEKLLREAAKARVELVVFPELSLTGYTCGDLFLKPALVLAAEKALADLLIRTRQLKVVFAVGIPVRAGTVLLNAAAVCYGGEILGVVPKTYLSGEENRWFSSALDWNGGEVELCGQLVPAGTDLLVEVAGAKVGVEIGTDLWSAVPPSSLATLQGADVICNLSARPALVGADTYTRELVAQQSARARCGYIYAAGGQGESTTDFVFDGTTLICENGALLARGERFKKDAQLVVSEVDIERLQNRRTADSSFRTDSAQQTQEPYLVIESGLPASPKPFALTRTIDALPFVPSDEKLQTNCQDIFNIQVTGLSTRLTAAHVKTAVIGISGGLDSTLALLVAVRAFDKLGWPRKNVIGVTMPGFGTTDRTYQNALALMKNLGISRREVDIKKACLQHFKDIGHDEKIKNATYENAQARERTQILMDIANAQNGLVVGTGDLSELALGWATYNGDHMSMYGVNAGVPKTLVRSLVAWVGAQEKAAVKRVLEDVLATPISPELLPAKNGKIAQKTEDLVGPYELHDFFLYHFVRDGFGPEKILHLATYAFKGKFTAAVIKKWLAVFFRRFFTQQFKRSCSADGPKVGSVGLSPRGDWRMPSDACAEVWLSEIEKL
ncbi:NAD(+) synthase [Candidatus Avelusimicrobium caledoniensis]|uniref:NAD(+) synthase n=1 Tax=Candidatus Avelusimicrobium caledoniensis TaxID=3416220 RepID=UPI003D1067BE